MDKFTQTSNQIINEIFDYENNVVGRVADYTGRICDCLEDGDRETADMLMDDYIDVTNVAKETLGRDKPVIIIDPLLAMFLQDRFGEDGIDVERTAFEDAENMVDEVEVEDQEDMSDISNIAGAANAAFALPDPGKFKKLLPGSEARKISKIRHNILDSSLKMSGAFKKKMNNIAAGISE